jgi:5,5'-dehydrodivanillate O-demethylase
MTLSAEENAELVEVAQSTPMGALLRSYWHPVAISSEVLPGRTKPVRRLDQKLVLFRTTKGKLSLIDERCPHRGASLAYGMVDDDGIRCPYHGWLFDGTGRCLEQPNENSDHGFRDRVRQRVYPVEEVGGLIYAYLGPAPVPPFPLFDLLVDEHVERTIRTAVLPVNWLQIAENGLDPVHLEWLHGHLVNHLSRQRGGTDVYKIVPHEEIAFDCNDLGIVKRRRVIGQSFEEEDWTIGQLVLFPAGIYISNKFGRSIQFRVPIDKTTTWHIWYEVTDAPAAAPGPITVREAEVFRPDGSFNLDTIDGQDAMAWVTQGEIADRTVERLGQADKGINLFRKLLREQCAVVRSGASPRWSRLGEPGEVIELPRRRSSSPVRLDA